MSAPYGVPLLGSLPLEIAIREQGDAGTPIVAAAPDSTAAAAYRQLARNIVAELDKRPRAAAPISASLLLVGATPPTGFPTVPACQKRRGVVIRGPKSAAEAEPPLSAGALQCPGIGRAHV